MKCYRIYLSSSLVFLFVLMLGCATSPPLKPEDALQKRVDGLMQAKIHDKWDVVYSYYNSSYKKAVSQNQFLQISRKVKFKSCKIEKMDILPEENEANVKVKYDISMGGFDFKNASENQHWVKEGRQWFLKVNPHTNPFKKTN